MPRTIGSVLQEARVLLSDTRALPTLRYTDDELMQAFNGFMVETRAKRPDLFLSWGLRRPVPYYDTTDMVQFFPLDESVYDAFVYYVVGRCEAREDSFSEDSRAATLMNKAISQLLKVES